MENNFIIFIIESLEALRKYTVSLKGESKKIKQIDNALNELKKLKDKKSLEIKQAKPQYTDNVTDSIIIENKDIEKLLKNNNTVDIKIDSSSIIKKLLNRNLDTSIDTETETGED